MTLDRRSFLAGFLAVPTVSLWQPRVGLSPFGLQLYTIQPEIAKGLARTLDRVAAMGYREVESVGIDARSATEFRAALATSGLAAPSGHTAWATLGDRWPEVVEVAQTIGYQHLIITSLDRTLRTQPGIWNRVGDQLNRAGEVCRAAKIKLGYHNHLFEFARIGGQSKRPYDLLMEGTDPALVGMQMDLAWTVAAGQDPVTLLRTHKNRYLSVHVKDLKRLPSPPSDGSVADRDSLIPDLVDVGAGVLDWKTLLGAARAAGVAHYFVEHDRPTDPLATAENSARYLSRLNLQ